MAMVCLMRFSLRIFEMDYIVVSSLQEKEQKN